MKEGEIDSEYVGPLKQYFHTVVAVHQPSSFLNGSTLSTPTSPNMRFSMDTYPGPNFGEEKLDSAFKGGEKGMRPETNKEKKLEIALTYTKSVHGFLLATHRGSGDLARGISMINVTKLDLC